MCKRPATSHHLRFAQLLFGEGVRNVPTVAEILWCVALVLLKEVSVENAEHETALESKQCQASALLGALLI